MKSTPLAAVIDAPENITDFICHFCQNLAYKATFDVSSKISCEICFLDKHNYNGDLTVIPSFTRFKLFDRLIAEIDVKCLKNNCSWKGKAGRDYLSHSCGAKSYLSQSSGRKEKKKPNMQIFFTSSKEYNCEGTTIRFLDISTFRPVVSRYSVGDSDFSWKVSIPEKNSNYWFCTGLAKRDLIESDKFAFIINPLNYEGSGIFGVSCDGSTWNCNVREQNNKGKMKQLREISVKFVAEEKKLVCKLGEKLTVLEDVDSLNALSPFIVTFEPNSVFEAKRIKSDSF